MILFLKHSTLFHFNFEFFYLKTMYKNEIDFISSRYLKVFSIYLLINMQRIQNTHTKRKEIRKVVSSYWVLTEYWFCGTYPIIVSLSAWLMLPTFFCRCVVKSISYKVESFIVQILFYSRHFSKHFLIFNLHTIHDGSKIHLHVVEQ